MFFKSAKKKKELASNIKQRSTIKDPTTDAFKKSGRSAANILGKLLGDLLGEINQEHRIFDFGAGSGRVAIPMLEMYPAMQLYCNDVDKEAIEYLALNTPDNCITAVNDYNPPLDFEDNFFDAMYSVSVWSHFPEELGLEWLHEMNRIHKKGAYLLISTAGNNVIEHWSKSTAQWRDTTADELREKKFIYKEFLNIDTDEQFYPGISSKGSWGNTLIHPDYIKENWGKIFNVVEIIEGGMNGMQDIVILQKR
jgi:SAM-dependent methyltransferase